jgi:hypothetical protein
MIFVKPWLQTVYVEMMLACQKEDLLPFHVDLQANSAHAVGVFLDHSLYGDLHQDVFFHTHGLLDLLSHVLVVEGFEGGNVHAVDRGLTDVWVIQTLIFKDSLPLIVPIDEIQVVLPSRIEFDWHIFL